MGASGSGRKPMPTIWRIPDELWLIVRTVLPAEELRRSRGRPWIESRRVLDGVLYAMVITAANTPDKTALAELLDARVVRPAPHTVQHLCLDKGYDYADVDEAVGRRRYVGHIRRRGEERRRCRRGERARRWVVERTHSWFNRCRKLLIRWEKKPQNYLALLQFAATLVVFRLVG